jgi:Cu-Zn family superoxide dismutase
VTDRLTLAPGPISVFDADGSAVVVHAGADDQRTDPSGNSGDRVLCGQIVAGPAGAFSPRP